MSDSFLAECSKGSWECFEAIRTLARAGRLHTVATTAEVPAQLVSRVFIGFMDAFERAGEEQVRRMVLDSLVVLARRLLHSANDINEYTWDVVLNVAREAADKELHWILCLEWLERRIEQGREVNGYWLDKFFKEELRSGNRTRAERLADLCWQAVKNGIKGLTAEHVFIQLVELDAPERAAAALEVTLRDSRLHSWDNIGRYHENRWTSRWPQAVGQQGVRCWGGL